MIPHTPKWAPIWELESQWISEYLKSDFKGQKFIGLKSSLHNWKPFETLKMGSHDPFEYLKHKLWPKKGPKIKLPIWLPGQNDI